MTTKEKLQFGLQVFTILIFATLANKAIENKGSHGPMSSFHPMKGENMFIMDMDNMDGCLLYTSPSPRDLSTSRMPSSAWKNVYSAHSSA